MSQFANTFTTIEIRQLPVAQISWRTIITIMSKCKNHKERLYYVELAYKNGWGRDMISSQIAMKAYERSLIEPTTTKIHAYVVIEVKIGISKYKFIEEIPEYLQKRLKSII